MVTTRVPHRLAETLLLSLIVITVGCQSVRGASHQVASETALAPPLSTMPDGVIPAGGTRFTGAPLQLAHDPAASAGAQPLIPALPESPAAISTTSSINPEQNSLLPGETPNVSGTLPGTSRQISSSITPAECLPSEKDWQKQMEDQTAALTRRLLQMEGELNSTRTELSTVQQALKASQSKIDQLNQDVAKWKGEFQRLEMEMRTQQLSDLKSLDELTESMHQVLLRQQSSARTNPTNE